MGAEAFPLPSSNNSNHCDNGQTDTHKPPLVLGLQPSALVDHVARVDWSLLDQIPGERGGSIPVFSSFIISFRISI